MPGPDPIDRIICLAGAGGDERLESRLDRLRVVIKIVIARVYRMRTLAQRVGI